MRPYQKTMREGACQVSRASPEQQNGNNQKGTMNKIPPLRYWTLGAGIGLMLLWLAQTIGPTLGIRWLVVGIVITIVSLTLIQEKERRND